jgi:hypothetical protein
MTRHIQSKRQNSEHVILLEWPYSKNGTRTHSATINGSYTYGNKIHWRQKLQWEINLFNRGTVCKGPTSDADVSGGRGPFNDPVSNYII